RDRDPAGRSAVTPALHPLALALVGALCALDDAACVSLLFGEPLFAAAVLGAACGRFAAAVAVGAGLQLVWGAPLRAGGPRTAEAWLGACAAVASVPADLVPARMGWLVAPALVAPALVGVVAAYAGGALRELVRAAIAPIADRAAAHAAAGRTG